MCIIQIVDGIVVDIRQGVPVINEPTDTECTFEIQDFDVPEDVEATACIDGDYAMVYHVDALNT